MEKNMENEMDTMSRQEFLRNPKQGNPLEMSSVLHGGHLEVIRGLNFRELLGGPGCS